MALPAAAGAAQVVVPSVPPRAEDVASIDGILAAFYDVISGPAGQPREWARDRTLYIAGVRFVSLDVRDGRPVASVMDHQQFVDRTDAGFVRDGFFEREIHRVTHRFGNLAHVFSTYEMRRTPDGPVFGRGVNSIELFWDGMRWWIAAAVWDDERPDNPIPADLLP
ncbi:MAG: hypothetical protein ACREMR_00095 [Gemmatimonadales bacterium]